MRKITVFAAALVVFSIAGEPAWAQNGCLSGRAGSSTAQGALIGGVLGGLLGGGTSNTRNRPQNTLIGAGVGAAMGGAVGCWTANEQSVAAAREDALNAQASQLEQTTARLRAYNAELNDKIVRLRVQIEQARSEGSAISRDMQAASSDLAASQQQAQQQLDGVNAAIVQVTRAAELEHSRPGGRYETLSRQRAELLAAKAYLEEILVMRA